MKLGQAGMWRKSAGQLQRDEPRGRATGAGAEQAAAHLGIVQAGERDHAALVQQHGDGEGLQGDADVGGEGQAHGAAPVEEQRRR